MALTLRKCTICLTLRNEVSFSTSQENILSNQVAETSASVSMSVLKLAYLRLFVTETVCQKKAEFITFEPIMLRKIYEPPD